MLVTLWYILLCVLMFSLAIAIHEFGHFIVALKLGLKVERFSIGFGPAIWKKTFRGVEYRLSCIPLGGYVSIPDVDPEGTKKLEGGETKAVAPARERIPAWKELLVAVAGPAMNLVLALVLAVILCCIPSARFGQLGTEIGGFAPGSVAKEAGLRVGDIIDAVAGHEVSTWSEMQTEIQVTGGKLSEFRVRRPRAMKGEKTLHFAGVRAGDGGPASGTGCTGSFRRPVVDGFWGDRTAEQAGLRTGDVIVRAGGEAVWSDADLAMALYSCETNSPLAVTVRRGGELVELALPVTTARTERGDGCGCVLQVYCATNSLAPVVTRVTNGGAAAEAGLRPFDRVIAVGDRPVETWADVERELLAAGEAGVEVRVERALAPSERTYDEVTVHLAPRQDPASGVYLIEAMSLPNENRAMAWMPSRNPFAQMWWDAGSIFRALKALVTPKEAKATSKAIGGPVVIAEGIYRSTRNDFTDGLGFLRFLNTNLAIMNLLPIPVLDGGLILFALIALVFRRRIPDRIVNVLSTCFMYLLLACMAFLIYRDSVRSWKIHHAEPVDPAAGITLVIPEAANAI